jgi:hypothetical protein
LGAPLGQPGTKPVPSFTILKRGSRESFAMCASTSAGVFDLKTE